MQNQSLAPLIGLPDEDQIVFTPMVSTTGGSGGTVDLGTLALYQGVFYQPPVCYPNGFCAPLTSYVPYNISVDIPDLLTLLDISDTGTVTKIQKPLSLSGQLIGDAVGDRTLVLASESLELAPSIDLIVRGTAIFEPNFLSGLQADVQADLLVLPNVGAGAPPPVATTPEPQSWLLLATGLGLAGCFGRRLRGIA